MASGYQDKDGLYYHHVSCLAHAQSSGNKEGKLEPGGKDSFVPLLLVRDQWSSVHFKSLYSTPQLADNVAGRLMTKQPSQPRKGGSGLESGVVRGEDWI